MRILLYCAVPVPHYNQKVRYGAIRAIYRRAYRTAIVLYSRLTHTARGNAFYLTDHTNTNKGDYAIVSAIEAQLRTIFSRERPQFSQLQWQQLTPERVATINRETDLFVIAGSGYLAFRNPTTLNDWLHRDIRLIDQLSCPVFVYGIGVNILLPAQGETTHPGPEIKPAKEALASIARLASKIRAGTVRDEQAYRLLKRETNTLRLLADPAFLWHQDDASPAAPAADCATIGLNIAAHNAMNWRSFKERFPTYLHLFSRLQETTRCRFKYFCHSSEELVVYRMFKSAGLRIDLVDRHPEQLQEEYKKIDLLICQMLHSAILCASVGTPVLNFAYNRKSQWFFKLIDYPAACQPRDLLTLTEYEEAISRTLATADTMRNALCAAKRQQLLDFTAAKSMLHAALTGDASTHHQHL